MNPVYSLFATPASFAPFFLRMALATVFFYHGTQKAFGWFGGDGWQQTLELWASVDGANLPGPAVAVIMVGELIIAAALFFGFLTRVAGLSVVLLMAGTLFYTQDGSFAAIEYSLVLMACGLALTGIGGGRLSVDRGLSANLLPAVG
jgi:putative oxidoreductase